MHTEGIDAVLVFSGGGNLGAAQVGMLHALLERGVRPRAVFGSSVGALNAAFVAVDPTPARVDLLDAAWRHVTADNVFGGNRLVGTVHVALGRRHLHHPRNLRRLIGEWFEPTDLSRTAIPLHVSTTELATGEVRWWRAGDPVDILAASAAIPVVFPPVELDGSLHVDGALIEPLGLARAAAVSDLPIIVLDAGATGSPFAEPASAVAMTVASIRAGRMASLHHIDELCSNPRVTWLRADLPALAYHDFTHTSELIELGRAAGATVPLPTNALRTVSDTLRNGLPDPAT